MLKVITIVAGLLAVLVLVYAGMRVREALAVRAMMRDVDEAEAYLAPLVFNGEDHYDRDAASLLAQARFAKHRIQSLQKAGKPILAERRLVQLLNDNVTLLQDGWAVFEGARGVILKGYRSDIDNSLRTYSVSVPPGYEEGGQTFLSADADGRQECLPHKWPLVVSLHGHGWFAPFQGHPASALTGAIVLSPEGRGPSDYMWIGEEDVLAAMEEVKRDYRVDASRVFITGTSMGGTGAWNVAAHHPHLFAGVGPRAGNCDPRAWESRWGWNAPLPGRHDDLRRWVLESDSPITFIGNLAPLPVFVMHNSADAVVPVEHARAAVGKLRALGGTVEYREFLIGNHGDFPESAAPDQMAWLAANARTTPPTHFHYETRDARHGATWYATIEQLDEVMKPAALDVKVEGETLSVKTTNVLALTVHPTPRAVSIDAQPFLPSASDGPDRTFIRAAGQWSLAAHWPPDDGMRKVKGSEGPVQDVFLSPFTLVKGTGGGPDWAQAADNETRRFVHDWTERFAGTPRVVADIDLTDNDAASRNLVFFGRASAGTVMAHILAEMPLTVDDNGITFAHERFEGPDVGAIFCYPTPNRPGRMTAVYSAVTPAALYQADTRFGHWFNWGIYDSRKWFDYAVYDAKTADPETFRVVGFFGTDWSTARGKSWRATPEALARVKPQGTPKFAKPPADATVYVSDLVPALIDQMRGAVEFDRSFRGHPITMGALTFERGLGVRCTSRIEYDLGAGGFRTFHATVGFTDEPEEALSVPRENGESVGFILLGDGRELMRQQIGRTGKLSPMKAVDIDVTGVKKLALIVESAGGALWLHGSTAWADARLER